MFYTINNSPLLVTKQGLYGNNYFEILQIVSSAFEQSFLIVLEHLCTTVDQWNWGHTALKTFQLIWTLHVHSRYFTHKNCQWYSSSQLKNWNWSIVKIQTLSHNHQRISHIYNFLWIYICALSVACEKVVLFRFETTASAKFVKWKKASIKIKFREKQDM